MVVKVVHPKCVIKFQQPNFSNLQAKLSLGLYWINKKFTKVGFVNFLVKIMKENRQKEENLLQLQAFNWFIMLINLRH